MFSKTRFLFILLIVLSLGVGPVLAQENAESQPAVASGGHGSATHVSGQFFLTLFGGPGCNSPTGLCTTGTVNGGIVGDVFSDVTVFDERPTFIFVEGNTTITTADGVLYTELRGKVNTSNGTSATRLRIVGGTGIYEGARGMIINRGVLDPNTGVEVVDYRGVIVVN